MAWNLYDHVEQADNPQWDKAGKVHDWRNHVPDEIMALWPNLTTEARCVAVHMAQQLADWEEWE